MRKLHPALVLISIAGLFAAQFRPHSEALSARSQRSQQSITAQSADPGTFDGTVRTSIQQTWIDPAQQGILEIISHHDLFQGPLTDAQIARLRSYNPEILLTPFDSMLDSGASAKSAASGEKPSELWLADPDDFGVEKRVWWDVGDECNPVGEECYRSWKAEKAFAYAASKDYDGMYLDLWQTPWQGLFPMPRMGEEEYIDGMTDFADLLRQSWPGAILLANGARALYFSYSLNGYMWEDFPTFAWPGNVNQILEEEEHWRQHTSGYAASRIGPNLILLNIRARDYDQNDPRFWQSMRYATGISLLGDDLYVAFNSGWGGSPHWANAYWFDEWSIDLGDPVGPAGQLENGAWFRQYTQGLVLVSDSQDGLTIRDQDLKNALPAYEGPYYRFRGSQQPAFNNGVVVGNDERNRILLSAFYRGEIDGKPTNKIGDAILLLKEPATIVSPIYLDDTNCRGPNNIQGEFIHEGMLTFIQEGMDSFCQNHFSPFPNSWRYYPRDTAHYAPPGDGSKTARWTPRIGVPGRYEVFARFPNQVHERVTSREGFNASDIASRANFIISHAEGVTEKTINQREEGGDWISLGTYAFREGTQDHVTLTDAAEGYVLADAIKLIWRGENQAPIFGDVPYDHWAKDYIEILYKEGFTSGCSTDPLLYCPDAIMSRAESAVFVERGIWGTDHNPPQPPEPVFSDLPLDSWAARWVTALWNDGYTSGCLSDPLMYCPWRGHTRAEGAVFYLRMMYGKDYLPPDPEGIFADVPLDWWGAKWAEAAYRAGIIPACETEPELRFCPQDPLDRAMAAFMMVQAKDLPTP